VLPLKDPTSDMAVISRNGSKLVKEVRDKKEANKSRARFWEVAGSKMGKITGARVRGHTTTVTSLWTMHPLIWGCTRHHAWVAYLPSSDCILTRMSEAQ